MHRYADDNIVFACPRSSRCQPCSRANRDTRPRFESSISAPGSRTVVSYRSSPSWRFDAAVFKYQGHGCATGRDEANCKGQVRVGQLHMRGLVSLTRYRPNEPLRALGEYLIQKSKELEGTS